MIFQIVSNLLLTILIEVPLFCFFLGKNKIKDVLFCFLLNAATNLAVQGLFQIVKYNNKIFLLAEACVILLECIFIFIYFRNFISIFLTVIANVLSASLGYILTMYMLSADIDFRIIFIILGSIFLVNGLGFFYYKLRHFYESRND